MEFYSKFVKCFEKFSFLVIKIKKKNLFNEIKQSRAWLKDAPTTLTDRKRVSYMLEIWALSVPVKAD